MTTTEPSQPADEPDASPSPQPVAESASPEAPPNRLTRASAAWVATGAALVLLTLLIVFILQNQDDVEIKLFGFEGTIPVGMALLIAAVTGGGLVAVAGVARVLQLRRDVRRAR